MSGCIHQPKPRLENYTPKQLNNFQSEAEFNQYLANVSQLRDYREYQRIKSYKSDNQRITITGSRISRPSSSITNNLVEGVDEGDIVKLVGNHLVIIKRGKLYSAALSNENENENDLRPVRKVKITPPNWNHDSWYDELLILDRTLIVLGYGYDLEATENRKV